MERMLVRNAKVFTGEGEAFASAFVIEDGRFTWVGEDAEAPTPEPGEDVLDLGGATVLPGLLDVHTHPALLASLVDAVSVLPPAVSSIEDLVATLSASDLVGAGEDVWVEAYGYDDSRYPEGRVPTRHDLDRVSTTQPLFVRRCDAHSAVVNSAALRLAGVTRDTPDPAGAEIGRDEHGEPDGRLIEPDAMDFATRLMPEPTTEQWVDRMARLGTHFLSRGLVGAGDLVSSFAPDALTSFRAAAERACLPRLGLYPLWAHIKDAPPTLTDEDRSGHVFMAGCKVLLDGAYSNATAWTHDPYRGRATTASGPPARRTSPTPPRGPGPTASRSPATRWAMRPSTPSSTSSPTRTAGWVTCPRCASSTPRCSPPSGSPACGTHGCRSPW